MDSHFLNIALIVPSEREIKSLLVFISKYKNVKTDVFHSIPHFRKASQKKTYSGILLDDEIAEDTSTIDTTLLYLLDLGYPLMKIHKNVENNQQDKKQMNDFICSRCVPMKVLQARVNIHQQGLSEAEIYLTPRGNPLDIQLWDISEEGCFLITKNLEEKVSEGDLIWLRIKNLSDPTLILCKIEWKRYEAINSEKPSGYGVSFVEIKNHQFAELKDKLVRILPDSDTCLPNPSV